MKIALWTLALALLVGACAIPLTYSLDPATGTLHATEVGYAVPLTGLVPMVSPVDTTPAEDGSLLGMLFKAAGIYVSARLGQSVLTKSGRANWKVIGDGEASWGGTFGSVLHNFIGTSSPPEARAKMPDAPIPDSRGVGQ